MMWAENDSWLSRVIPRFLAVWDGVTVELSMDRERSSRGESLQGKKRSSVLSGLSLR